MSNPNTKQREPGDDSFLAEEGFLALFRSNPDSFVVRKRVAEKPDEDGKRSAAYTTLTRKISLSDVAAHFAGKTCLVLKPELPDGTCLWAMIDHDVYSPQRCQIIGEEIQTLGLPLYPFPSKSGGLHTAIFFKTPQPAPQVRALLADFARQLGEQPTCEIFPKPVADGKKPYGIAVPFFGERDEFESFEPVYYDGPLNGHPPQSPADLPAYGVRIPDGVDFGELLQSKLKCNVLHEAGGVSYAYHGIGGQPCLIKGALHSPNKDNPRCSRFFVKDGYVCHQCFADSCRGDDEPKTRKTLAAIGIDFRTEPPRSLPQNAVPWPEPLAEEAFHGLAGEVVRAIEPHSEADPAALLVQFLVAFGNIADCGSFFSVEDTKHHANLFCLIVGETSKSRKGTSWDRIERIFKRLEDDEWASLRILGGTSSGEGIIEQVRDAIVKGNDVDAGAPDKRLLLNETEFAQVLAVIRRDGNTASEVLRRAWDGNKPLQTLTRQRNALKATGAHISLIGHITRTELLRHLDETEVANGLMNRFLFCCAKKSKLLPFGGSMNERDISPLVLMLAVAVEFAKRDRELRWDEEAKPLWVEVYKELSKDHLGLFGAVIARAEPQVLRLSILYALLDRSEAIRREHLAAARSVWRYCEDSARHIFGDALGNPVADEILRALRANPEGMTRTAISDLFGRHHPKDRIGKALSILLQHGLANFFTEKDTGGRPVERWRANKAK
jgi:hypothetical protein